MQPTSTRCNTGFTLIEVMVAMLILLVCLLGLLEALNVAMQNNTKNLMRDNAFRIAEDTMYAMKNQPITAAFTPITSITSTIRGVPKIFSVRRATMTLPSSAVQYEVTVKWAFKNLTTSHTIASVRGNQ